MKMVQTESNLWDAFQQGDIEAFETIYRTHSSALLAYGKRLCTDHDVVKDTVQDIFVEIWMRRGNLRSLHTIKFYLFKIMRNKLSKRHQKSAGFSSTDELSLVEDELLTPSVELLITQEETITDQQTRLQGAIALLPARQREAVMLAFYHDFSNEEIAGIMGINHQSVTNHLNRAYSSLRNILSDFITLLLTVVYSLSGIRFE